MKIDDANKQLLDRSNKNFVSANAELVKPIETLPLADIKKTKDCDLTNSFKFTDYDTWRNEMRNFIAVVTFYFFVSFIITAPLNILFYGEINSWVLVACPLLTLALMVWFNPAVYSKEENSGYDKED